MTIENSSSALLLLLCQSWLSRRPGEHTLVGLDKGNIIKVNVYIVFIEVFKVYVLPLQAACCSSED